MGFRAFVGVELIAPCTSCGAPVPVNRPELETRCTACLANSEVPQDIWLAALRGVAEDFRKLGRGVLGPGKLERTGLDAEWSRGPDHVACPSCPGRMHPDPPMAHVVCERCGARRPIAPPPDWMVAEGADVRGVIADPPERDPEQSAPMAIQCSSCGASLRTDGRTRMVPCQYCSTKTVLPDDVWRALHPPRRKKRFWLLLDLPDDPRRLTPPGVARESVPWITFVSLMAGLIGALTMMLVGMPVVLALLFGFDLDREAIESGFKVYLAGCFAVAALLAFVYLYRDNRREIALLVPDHEVIGRLGPWSTTGKVEVTLVRPGDNRTPLATTALSVDEDDYRKLGGEGASVRAWFDGKGKPQTRALPSALVDGSSQRRQSLADVRPASEHGVGEV